MDPSKWLPKLPLFDSLICVYCGAPANTSDHTPPRCFLPRKMPSNIQAMTVPACASCNASYSQDEIRAAAVICTVSFTEADQKAVGPGGRIHTAIQRDNKLRSFVEKRLDHDGLFKADKEVLDVLHRVIKKTALGLLFFEFGRIVRVSELTVIAIEHAKNIPPSTFVGLHRGMAEVTPSGRGLERQVMAWYGLESRRGLKWNVFIPEYFEYLFIKRSNRTLICAMKIHDSLTALLECPWPSKAGPRRVERQTR